MDYVVLTRESLCLDKISDLVLHESCGALSCFAGTTRDNCDGKKVLSLQYEAYEPMAVKEMEVICKEIRTIWKNVGNIAIYHRLGTVDVTEKSVVIVISSPHRKCAIDAVSYAIEELKKRVPIWKKEQYENDEAVWKENKECQWRSNNLEENFPNL